MAEYWNMLNRKLDPAQQINCKINPARSEFTRMKITLRDPHLITSYRKVRKTSYQLMVAGKIERKCEIGMKKVPWLGNIRYWTWLNYEEFVREEYRKKISKYSRTSTE